METEDKKIIQILQSIRTTVESIEKRQDTNELLEKSSQLFDKVQRRSDDALIKIERSFDRIHDKLFTFNNILIAAFLTLSKYPNDNAIFDLWTAFLPIANLLLLMYLEKSQMEIYRHASVEMDWIEVDRSKYEKMITKQNIGSGIAIMSTLAIFSFLFLSVLTY